MGNSSDNVSSQQLLKSILDSSLDGIMAFKSVRNLKNEIVDFEWIFVNDVAEAIVQRQADYLIGRKLLEEMPGNKDAGLFDKYVSVVETGQYTTLEQYYSADGITKWFKISAVKLNDGFTVTFQDISELKQALVDLENKAKS
jgi:PAS domain S-box-containing protein